jgi:hypothetical protein
VGTGLKEGVGVPREIGRGTVNEALRMCLDPGVVPREMVGHEVQNQAEAAGCQLLAREGQAGESSEAAVGHISADAVRRGRDILRRQVGERAPELLL